MSTERKAKTYTYEVAIESQLTYQALYIQYFINLHNPQVVTRVSPFRRGQVQRMLRTSPKIIDLEKGKHNIQTQECQLSLSCYTTLVLTQILFINCPCTLAEVTVTRTFTLLLQIHLQSEGPINVKLNYYLPMSETRCGLAWHRQRPSLAHLTAVRYYKGSTCLQHVKKKKSACTCMTYKWYKTYESMATVSLRNQQPPPYEQYARVL